MKDALKMLSPVALLKIVSAGAVSLLGWPAGVIALMLGYAVTMMSELYLVSGFNESSETWLSDERIVPVRMC